MKRTVKSRHDGRPRAGSRAQLSAPPRPRRRVATHWLIAVLAVGFAASTWPGCGSTVCDKSSDYINSCMGTTTTTTATTTATTSTSGVGGSSSQTTETGGGTNAAASECVGEDECAANCNNAASCTEIIDYYGGTASSASADLQACLAGCYVNSTAMGASSSSSTGGSGLGGSAGSGAGSLGGSGGAGGTGGTGGAAGGGIGGAGGLGGAGGA
ncbi:MAG TPA: hypothetical protein VGM56_24300 [Byssovorax sp.]